MKESYENMKKAILHLEILHNIFLKKDKTYKKFNEKLIEILEKIDFFSQLYNKKGRQMILSDLLEYIFLGRGYYSIRNKEHKSMFIKAILYFVNMLMIYDSLTVNTDLRKELLEKLEKEIADLSTEDLYEKLKNFNGKIGLKLEETEADKDLNKYFDTFLPKTAGGLWHELLAYIFLLRNDVGYVIPLLLNQRLLSLEDHLVPPDFLIITYDKKIYGVEVGTKKEIQSGAFSLKTGIPTATLDTENSRNSDRCPICKKWILFCDYVIEKYSNLDEDPPDPSKIEIKCLDEECDMYSKDEIANGKCPNTKYSRSRAKTLDYTHHKYADGRHYHYQCVLESVEKDMKQKIIEAKDRTALKTHYPYYPGLDELIKERKVFKKLRKLV